MKLSLIIGMLLLLSSPVLAQSQKKSTPRQQAEIKAKKNSKDNDLATVRKPHGRPSKINLNTLGQKSETGPTSNFRQPSTLEKPMIAYQIIDQLPRGMQEDGIQFCHEDQDVELLELISTTAIRYFSNGAQVEAKIRKGQVQEIRKSIALNGSEGIDVIKRFTKMLAAPGYLNLTQEKTDQAYNHLINSYEAIVLNCVDKEMQKANERATQETTVEHLGTQDRNLEIDKSTPKIEKLKFKLKQAGA